MLYDRPVFATGLLDIWDELPNNAQAPREADRFSSRFAREPSIAGALNLALSCADIGDHIDDTTEIVKLILERWKDELQQPKPTPNYLLYVLEHGYSDEFDGFMQIRKDLRQGQLQDPDKTRCSILASACEATGCHLFLSTLNRCDEEEDEDDDDDDYESDDSHAFSEKSSRVVGKKEYSLGRTQDLNGDVLGMNLGVSAENVVQMSFAKAWDNDTEVDPQVMLIVPHLKEYLQGMILTERCWTDGPFNYLLRKSQKNASDNTHLSILQDICNALISEKEKELRAPSHPRSILMSDPIRHVASMAIELQDRTMLRRTLQCFREGTPFEMFTTLSKAVGLMPFEHIVDGINICIDTYPNFRKRFEAINELFTINSEMLGTPQGRWFVDRMEECLQGPGILARDVHEPLLRFVLLRGGDDYLLGRILPILEHHANETPFIICFLNYAWDSTPNISRGATSIIFSHLLSKIHGQYDLLRWSLQAYLRYNCNGPDKITLRPPYEYATPHVQVSPIDGTQLGIFLDHCFELGKNHDAEKIIEKFNGDIDNFHVSDYAPTMLACLKTLSSVLTKREIAPSPTYETVFKHGMVTYLQRYVQQEPARPGDLSRNPVSCVRSRFGNFCRDCEELNVFLRDPNQESLDWKVAKDKHSHLDQAMRAAKSDCQTHSRKVDKWWHLEVRKTTKLFNRAYEEWDARRKEADRHFAEFDQGALKRLLGPQHDEIMSMKIVRLLEPWERPGRVLQPIAPSFQSGTPHLDDQCSGEQLAMNGGAGTKRPLASAFPKTPVKDANKSVVIDLTGGITCDENKRPRFM